jgi:hypothetical protein
MRRRTIASQRQAGDVISVGDDGCWSISDDDRSGLATIVVCCSPECNVRSDASACVTSSVSAAPMRDHRVRGHSVVRPGTATRFDTQTARSSTNAIAGGGRPDHVTRSGSTRRLRADPDATFERSSAIWSRAVLNQSRSCALTSDSAIARSAGTSTTADAEPAARPDMPRRCVSKSTPACRLEPDLVPRSNQSPHCSRERTRAKPG